MKPADIAKIRDPYLRDILWDRTRDLTGKDFTAALDKFADTSPHYRGLRHVRMVEKLNTIPIKDKSGNAYKGYKGDSNHCVEVWRLLDGTWKSMILTPFDANKHGLGYTRPHPAAKLVMRLFKKDAVALDHPKLGYLQASIAKMSLARIDLFPPNDARSRSKDDTFDYIRVSLGTFQKYNLRKIGIDILGRVTDPGPHKN